MRRTILIGLLFAISAALFGCQEVEQPTTVLTQEQWKDVKKHILKKAPETKYPVNAEFDEKIELIGFNVDGPVIPGKKATFTWYWKALDDVEKNWKVFVHLDSNAKPFRQNLDHVPVNGMYQTSRWKKGQIIEDIQEVTLRADYPPGPATPYIGFWRGKKRMNVTNDVQKTGEAQPRVIGPKVIIGKPDKKAAKKAKKPKPTYSVRELPASVGKQIAVDGKLDEDVWDQLPLAKLSPLGGAPKLATWAKVFVTDEHFYIGAHLEDQHIWGDLEKRDADTWTQEVLELFIDVDGDGADYLELQITPQETIFDANFKKRLGTGKGSREDQINAARTWNLSGLESAVHVEGTLNKKDDEDEFWSVELKIPLKSIPGLSKAPEVNDKWAVNLYRFDRPDKDKSFAYAWSTEPRGDFHQVDKFGTFRFIGTSAMKRPKLSPEMLKRIKKNINLKVQKKAPDKVKVAPKKKPGTPDKPSAGSAENPDKEDKKK